MAKTTIARIQRNDLAISQGEPDEELCKIISKVNQLRPYPLSAIEVMEWAASLEKIGVDYGALRHLIWQMILGNYDYDKSLGIQNLVNGLRKVKKTETGSYKIQDHTW